MQPDPGIEAERKDKTQRNLEQGRRNTPDKGIQDSATKYEILSEDLAEIGEADEFRLEPKVSPERVDAVVKSHRYREEHEAEV
jgi:hypothetical protein